ncbi:MAG TPA: AraC family transcriptional regulator [Alphaproteobacteria bacterium]|nr:AraC family transcriptional regulator [Alphaproteobacteria bacterium]
MALPLARHVAFETADLDEARERVARVFRPHRLDFEHPGQRLDARQHVARLGALVFSYVAYGADVAIDPGATETFFLVHLVRSGRSMIRNGRETVIGRPGVGSVTTATEPLAMRWSADCAHLLLKIERGALERHLADLLGAPVARPIEFRAELPVADGLGGSLRRAIEFACAELDAEDGSLLGSPLGVARIEQMLLTGLLTAQPHSYAAALAALASPAAPRHVVRAQDYIRAHPDRPITVGELAAVAGVGARTLYEGFRRFRGTTPMAYLKAIRLERAHAELKAAALDASVTEIALRWGFVHLGRFAQDYHRRYGERPSETLRR